MFKNNFAIQVVTKIMKAFEKGDINMNKVKERSIEMITLLDTTIANVVSLHFFQKQLKNLDHEITEVTLDKSYYVFVMFLPSTALVAER